MVFISLAVTLGGIVIMIVGFSVMKKGSTAFIAGNNEIFIPKNEKKLAARFGLNIMIFGLEAALFPIAYHFLNIDGSLLAILAGFHLLIVFLLIGLDQAGK